MLEQLRSPLTDTFFCVFLYYTKTSKSNKNLSGTLARITSCATLSSFHWHFVVSCEVLLIMQEPKLCSHFDWFSPMIYWRSDAQLRSSLESFSFCILKRRRVLGINVINYLITWSRDWAKIKNKKSLVEELNRYEKQEEVRKKRFLFFKWLKKNTRTVLQRY